MATSKGFGQEYPGADAARSVIRRVLERYGPRDFAVQLWDGEQWPAQAEQRTRFKLILRNPIVVRLVQSARLAEFWRGLRLQPVGYQGFAAGYFRPRRSFDDPPLVLRRAVPIADTTMVDPGTEIRSAGPIRRVRWPGSQSLEDRKSVV